MSKILIENYRGIDITYDNSSEEFRCVISNESKKEGNYLSVIRKFIDEYKRLNSDFVPFNAIPNPDSRFGASKGVKIIGIRKDGRFISQNDSGEKGQISEFDEKNYILDKPENEKGLQELRDLSQAEEKLRVENNRRRAEIISSLNLVTIRDFKATILK